MEWVNQKEKKKSRKKESGNEFASGQIASRRKPGGASERSPPLDLDYSHYLLEKNTGCSKR
jgi:hypothetical protein